MVNSADDDVAQYDVGPGGALSPKSPATVPVGNNPFGIAVRSTLGTPPPPPTIADVIASVQALGLPGGIEGALLAKLTGAQQDLDANNNARGVRQARRVRQTRSRARTPSRSRPPTRKR